MNKPQVGDVWIYNRPVAPTSYEIEAIDVNTNAIHLYELEDKHRQKYPLDVFQKSDMWILKSLDGGEDKPEPKVGDVWTFDAGDLGTKLDYVILEIRERHAEIRCLKTGEVATNYPLSLFHDTKFWFRKSEAKAEEEIQAEEDPSSNIIEI